MPGMMEKFKRFLTGGDEVDYKIDGGVDDVNGGYEEFYDPMAENGINENYGDYADSQIYDETYIEEPVQKTTPVYQQPASTVVMLSPSDIRTSQIVCDHIREGHIVICNLTASSNNQRIVDYISGAVYAFDGKIEPTAVKTTFVCTPKSVNLIVNPDDASGSLSGTKVSAL